MVIPYSLHLTVRLLGDMLIPFCQVVKRYVTMLVPCGQAQTGTEAITVTEDVKETDRSRAGV